MANAVKIGRPLRLKIFLADAERSSGASGGVAIEPRRCLVRIARANDVGAVQRAKRIAGRWAARRRSARHALFSHWQAPRRSKDLSPAPDAHVGSLLQWQENATAILATISASSCFQCRAGTEIEVTCLRTTPTRLDASFACCS